MYFLIVWIDLVCSYWNAQNLKIKCNISNHYLLVLHFRKSQTTVGKQTTGVSLPTNHLLVPAIKPWLQKASITQSIKAKDEMAPGTSFSVSHGPSVPSSKPTPFLCDALTNCIIIQTVYWIWRAAPKHILFLTWNYGCCKGKLQTPCLSIFSAQRVTVTMMPQMRVLAENESFDSTDITTNCCLLFSKLSPVISFPVIHGWLCNVCWLWCFSCFSPIMK